MKVLHVETGRHLYGGAQQVLYITKGLSERGVDNVLVCPPGSDIAVAANAAGINTVELPCRGDLDVKFVWRLRQVMAELNPDLVHCHSRRGADFLGGQAAAMLGIPAVVSRRVDNVESRFVAGLRYRRFRRVIAISQAIANVLIEAGLDRRKLVVIRSAVDVERFAEAPNRDVLRREFGIGSKQIAVACAAQLIPRKGQMDLLAAVARLQPSHSELRVVLFGQGRDERRLRDLRDELGLGTSVQFAGFRDDLDSYLGAFDLLVHPALTEGLGVVALKAQAAGVPVIASAAGGLAEVVVDGKTGLLVPPSDDKRLADAMTKLIDDSALRDRYAKAARDHARAQFSVEPMVAAHLRLYETLLNG